MASWFLVGWTFPLAANSSFRWPRQRAGLSPDRKRRTVAQLSTFSMRPRRREAVSHLAFQIGCRTLTTCSVVMLSTGRSPRTGNAYCSSVVAHGRRCSEFVPSASWSFMYSVEHCLNVSDDLPPALDIAHELRREISRRADDHVVAQCLDALLHLRRGEDANALVVQFIHD